MGKYKKLRMTTLLFLDDATNKGYLFLSNGYAEETVPDAILPNSEMAVKLLGKHQYTEYNTPEGLFLILNGKKKGLYRSNEAIASDKFAKGVADAETEAGKVGVIAGAGLAAAAAAPTVLPWAANAYSAWAAAHPFVTGAVDLALTGSGIHHALSGDGLLKTWRLGNQAYQLYKAGNSDWKKTAFQTVKSGAGDALDLAGAYGLGKKVYNVGKGWYNAGDDFLRGLQSIDREGNVVSLTPEEVKEASEKLGPLKKTYVGFAYKNSKPLSAFGEKIDKYVPDVLRKLVADIYPTPSIHLSAKDMEQYNKGIDFLEQDVIPRIPYNGQQITLKPYVKTPYYMGKAETLAEPSVAGYHWTQNAINPQDIITIKPGSLSSEIYSTAVHEGRHSLQSRLANDVVDTNEVTRLSRQLDSLWDKLKNATDEERLAILDQMDQIYRNQRVGLYSINGYLPHESNLLDDAYFVEHSGSPVFEDSKLLKEKGATNTEIRSLISQDYGGAVGQKLDEIIEHMSPQELTNYMTKVNGYSSGDYLPSLLELDKPLDVINSVKKSLRYVPVLGAPFLINKTQNQYKTGGQFNYLKYIK